MCIFSLFLLSCANKDTVSHEHLYQKIISPATCESKGSVSFVCECGDVCLDNQTELPALGHDYVLTKLILDESPIKNPAEFTCSGCNHKKIDELHSKDVGMPILSFDGDISEMTKEVRANIAVKYETETETIISNATLKWQGASSLSYPKKNYTLQLLKPDSNEKNKVVLNESWGKQSKYCLKANYIDYSQLRNVVSGQIYNEIVHSLDMNDNIATVENGGVVDGFPVLIYINGTYQGLYTLNIPKDKWMFGMKDDKETDDTVTKQALIMGDAWVGGGVMLREEVAEDYVSSGFELEYCSTEDTIGTAWVRESFNSMIRFINDNDGASFKEGITDYVNVERVIDSMIYTLFIMAEDNTAKNVIWVTYDGSHWFSSMYDMDGTWGLAWNGMFESNYEPETVKEYYLSVNCLWEKIYKNYKNDIASRYFELRDSVLSISNIENAFSSFDAKIPTIVRIGEKTKWCDVPNQETNNLTQILDFAKRRALTLDAFFEAFVE